MKAMHKISPPLKSAQYHILDKKIIQLKKLYQTEMTLPEIAEQLKVSNTTLQQKIKDYHKGLNFVWNTYKNANKRDWNFVLHHLFPNMLKQQLDQIKRSTIESQPDLYKAFAEELVDLNKKGCLSFWGHKISRWMKYRQLIRDAK